MYAIHNVYTFIALTAVLSLAVLLGLLSWSPRGPAAVVATPTTSRPAVSCTDITKNHSNNHKYYNCTPIVQSYPPMHTYTYSATVCVQMAAVLLWSTSIQNETNTLGLWSQESAYTAETKNDACIYMPIMNDRSILIIHILQIFQYQFPQRECALVHKQKK